MQLYNTLWCVFYEKNIMGSAANWQDKTIMGYKPRPYPITMMQPGGSTLCVQAELKHS